LTSLQELRELEFSKNDLEKIYAANYRQGNQGYAQRFLAHVVSVEPPPEIAASLRTIRWKVDNASGLLEPKHYQHVKISSLAERKVLAVPHAALLDSKVKAVYVWNEGVLQLRQIETGATDGEYVEIRSGLASDEIVVVSGKEGLRDGLKAQITVKGGGADGKK
jgi:hypothetical protein